MNRHAGRLIDHDKVAILEQYIERVGFRFEPAGAERRQGEVDGLATADPIGGPDRRPLHENVALADQPLHRGAALISEHRHQPDV